MFKHIEIAHFRSCHGVVLDDLGPLTVLVGRNAVGKTNILRAIQWLARTAASTTPEPILDESGEVSLDAVIGMTSYHYTLRCESAFLGKHGQLVESRRIESLRYVGDDGIPQAVFDRQREEVRLSGPQTLLVKIGASAPCMPALLSLLPTGSPAVDSIRPFLSLLQKTRYYSLDAGADEDSWPGRMPVPIRQTDYEKWLTRYRTLGDPGTSVLIRLLHMALAHDPRFEEIRGLLGADGLGLLHDIGVHSLPGPEARQSKQPDEEANRYHFVWFRPTPQTKEDFRGFGFEELATGTQRVIRILVSLIFDQSAVMLLEHPEDGIHRGLLRKLIDLLQKYSDPSQLIVSSHSPLVFNTLDPRAVRLVTMEEGATKVRPLTPEEVQVAGKFLEEDGSLADFLETVEED